MKFQIIKPYLYILVLFAIPLSIIPFLKNLKSDADIIAKDIDSDKNELKPTHIPFALAIHGGAGEISKETVSAEDESAYKTKLYEAIQKGILMLNNGDSAVDVVENVIKILEDSPLFNAGKGAVFTHNGTHELDASIMNGLNMKAGAIAGVTNIKNPIEAAHAVMSHSKHVLLSGKGAEEFAKEHKLEIVDQEYFYTDKCWESHQKTLKKEKDHSKLGTVGCVVLDKYGNLAAGTSTGGISNKKNGRIGDSPIIGAGTYADNETCAISATGHGEYFIRYAVAYDIVARMKYLDESLEKATKNVIYNLKINNGYGGVIGIDKFGNIAMPYSTKGMFRASCKSGEEPQIFLY